MSDAEVVDLRLARLRRQHDAAAQQISEALGVLRQDVAALQGEAGAVATGLTRMAGSMEDLAAETADTLRFCHACQQAWHETDLDALVRIRDRLMLKLVLKKDATPVSD
ncbi:hypothetical protein SAE02_75790 [Skermanella aerolata]|uniref:Uncharacterized protein n=1 Tax=Skermanella aerolata TaxID=393310 RepID=A0A512E3W5_9PROT|nr:hypothetical protein [Skermanella aerolata]KJB90568.1 hypothetical protein N826_38930 [Skermanella aerolata KACC 11604]GEO43431.1 hypothetical protein SAE02_75790 [Skermanella aerolata]